MPVTRKAAEMFTTRSLREQIGSGNTTLENTTQTHEHSHTFLSQPPPLED